MMLTAHTKHVSARIFMPTFVNLTIYIKGFFFQMTKIWLFQLGYKVNRPPFKLSFQALALCLRVPNEGLNIDFIIIYLYLHALQHY